jgi:hypothetical protein
MALMRAEVELDACDDGTGRIRRRRRLGANRYQYETEPRQSHASISSRFAAAGLQPRLQPGMPQA